MGHLVLAELEESVVGKIDEYRQDRAEGLFHLREHLHSVGYAHGYGFDLPNCMPRSLFSGLSPRRVSRVASRMVCFSGSGRNSNIDW